MSKTEILAELPRLDHHERREIARRLFEIEADAQTLADCDRRADERFREVFRGGVAHTVLAQRRWTRNCVTSRVR